MKDEIKGQKTQALIKGSDEEGTVDTSIDICKFIDNLLKEMECKNEK